MNDENEKLERDLQQLEQRRSTRTCTNDELIELAALYDYFHRKDDAIEVLEQLLAMDPTSIVGRVWLAEFLIVSPLVDEHHQRIMAITNEIVDAGGELAAAGYHLMAWVIYQTEDGRYNPEQQIDLLTKAVAAAPGWVLNHLNLAVAYQRAGSIPDARRQLQIALANQQVPSEGAKITDRKFEVLITGRWMSSESIRGFGGQGWLLADDAGNNPPG